MTERTLSRRSDVWAPAEARPSPSVEVPHARVGVRIDALVRALAWSIAALAVGNVGSLVLRHGVGVEFAFGLVPLFDLNDESSLGTWLSAVMLLTGACLALVLRRLAAEPVLRRGWGITGGLLLVMSLDEVASLHERLSLVMERTFQTGGYLLYAWVVPALLLVAVFVVVQVPFVRALPRALAQRLAVAGAIFVAAATGLEVVEAGEYARAEAFTFRFNALSAIEECMEMLATLFVLHLLLRHLRGVTKRVSVSLDADSASGAARPR